MQNMYQKLIAAQSYCRELLSLRGADGFNPEIGITLGSGLGGYASNMDIVLDIPYSDIPFFPVSTVSGHEGRLLFGYIEGTPSVLMQGRVHYYEGYTPQEAVIPVRTMVIMGAKDIILTNAVGGINDILKPGDFMAITDHIACFVPSPLIGPNIDELGERFPDMSQIYDPSLIKAAEKAAEALGIELKKGVYLQSTGPNYESAAEVRMYKTMGADAVGMSVGIEAIAAKHAGANVCGISFISNMATGISDTVLSHTEVQKIADEKSSAFEQLITGIVTRV